MVESVGKKLNQARVKRGLTIDEAAHATKLRPDKIAALEADDYTRFANNIYARGFLQIYARFLNVDVSEFARTLDNANPISVSDYQYLSNAPTPRPETTQVRREERRPPSLAPLVFFVFLVLAGLAGTWAVAKYRQINPDQTSKKSDSTEEPAAQGPAASTPQPAPQKPEGAPVVPAPRIAVSTPAPGRGPVPPPVAQAPIVPAPAAGTPAPATGGPLALAAATPGRLPGPGFKPEAPKHNDQDFVSPTTVQTADPASHGAPASGVNEVLVAVVKTTWITVRKDDPKAPPIFEDYVYPSANPLKLKGSRFFIDARDPTVVQITKNGLPVAYQAPNIPVQ
jgi:cytoskeletal protein RodZ